MDPKKKLKYTLNTFLFLSVIFFLLTFLFPQARFLKMIVGGIYVLLLPGFILTSAFLSKSRDFIEQFILSFILSISSISLLTFSFYLFIKVDFTLVNIGLVALFVSSVSLFFWYREVKKIVASSVS